MITVYTTDTCAYCKMVKKYLQAKGVEYVEEDVTNNAEKRQELFDKVGVMQVPVTTNGTDYTVGFQPAQLAKIVS